MGSRVFAGGNISTTWDKFESDHQCSDWCRYYKLPRDFESWPSNDAENAWAGLQDAGSLSNPLFLPDTQASEVDDVRKGTARTHGAKSTSISSTRR